jgi:hypothetical protein
MNVHVVVFSEDGDTNVAVFAEQADAREFARGLEDHVRWYINEQPVNQPGAATPRQADERIEIAYRDLRYDPPRHKRIVCRNQAQFERWLYLHGENVEVIATRQAEAS